MARDGLGKAGGRHPDAVRDELVATIKCSQSTIIRAPGANAPAAPCLIRHTEWDFLRPTFGAGAS
jgi:hypothetical protein